MRPLIVIRRTPKIDFMAWHKVGFAFSLLLTLSSIALFLTVGLNYGIDFVGGTLIEVRSTTGPANLAEMRQKLDALHIGDASLQGFGPPTDVLIRLPRQPGGDAAQEKGVPLASQTAGPGGVGPECGQRVDPGRRDRDHSGAVRDCRLHLVPLRVAVRRRRDDLNPAR